MRAETAIVSGAGAGGSTVPATASGSSPVLVAMLPLLLFLPACHAPAPGPAPPAHVAALELLARAPADRELRMEDLLPSAGTALTMMPVPVDGDRVTAAEDAATETWTVRPTDAHGATIEITYGEQRAEYVRLDAAGGAALTAVIDHAERALTLFDPPLVITKATLAPGDTLASAAAMTVVDAGNPGRQREAGTATRTLTYETDQIIRTATGEISAQRVEIRFEADLRLADVEQITTLWVVPGTGIMVKADARTVKILGLAGSPRKRRWVRTTAGEAVRH